VIFIEHRREELKAKFSDTGVRVMTIRFQFRLERHLFSVLCSGWLSLSLVVGCGSTEQASLTGKLPFVGSRNEISDESVYRQKFVTERDPAALNWLLRQRIQNEMSVAEVASIFGEAGERRFDDRDYKTNGGNYQTTDVAYQWGPDRKGRTIVLFFREGKLIHFDPSEIRGD
jgi:hypothetical protein